MNDELNKEKNKTETIDMPALWGDISVSTEIHPREKWFRDNKYAMFVHWGLYSQAAGVWGGKTWYGISEWLMHRAQIPVKEYEKLASQFNPAKFDATEWVRIAKNAGMRYIVLTTKHHEGFAMFHSKASRFNIVDATPFQRDPVAELAEACKKEGLGLGFYYSQFLDWHEPYAAGNDWDFGDTEERTKNFHIYLHEKALPQIRELLTNYGEVALIWFDCPGTITREACLHLQNLIRTLQPKCLINSRLGNGLGDYSSLGDQEIPVMGPEGMWEAVDTHNDTWAFAKEDCHWKSPREVLTRLLKIISNGGNYMLNVGPTGEGIIPTDSAEILLEAGKWLTRNGESIYGSKRSPIPAQAWGVCTQKPQRLYCHILSRPIDRKLIVPIIAPSVKEVKILSTGTILEWEIRENSVSINLPSSPAETPIEVVEIAYEGSVNRTDFGTYLYPALPNVFHAPFSKYRNCAIQKIHWMEKFGDWHALEVVSQLCNQSAITWNFNVISKGHYNVHLSYECNEEGNDSEFRLSCGETKFTFSLFCTGIRHFERRSFRKEWLGVVHMSETGSSSLILEALEIRGKNSVYIDSLTITQVE